MRTFAPVPSRILLATLASLALLAGCETTTSANTSSMGAGPGYDPKLCQVFRSYLDRPLVNVMEEGTRQMGEAGCRACLMQP